MFNAAIDRRPALIARCARSDDVVEAVNFAQAENLLVSVRGGGHNVAGYAVCDDGMVIDLSNMKAITVNPTARTVRPEGGCNWGELNDALQPHGLAATGGFVSITGVSGLTLGGGLGWLVRKHGLALDNLLSADVVLADGRHVTASARENDDLFWAIRGGGGNFGVVTSFEFQAHPLTTVLAGIVLHPAAAGGAAIRRWRDLEPTAPAESTQGALLFHLPDDASRPPPAEGEVRSDELFPHESKHCAELGRGDRVKEAVTRRNLRQATVGGGLWCQNTAGGLRPAPTGEHGGAAKCTASTAW